MFQNQEDHLNYIKSSLYESQQFQQKIQQSQSHQYSQQNLQNQSQSQLQSKQELLKFTIDIGNGRKGSIHIFEGDEPKDLAQNFCQKYELDTNIVDILVENINQHLQQTLSQVSQASQFQFQDMQDQQNSMSQRESEEQYDNNQSQQQIQQLPGGQKFYKNKDDYNNFSNQSLQQLPGGQQYNQEQNNEQQNDQYEQQNDYDEQQNNYDEQDYQLTKTINNMNNQNSDTQQLQQIEQNCNQIYKQTQDLQNINESSEFKNMDQQEQYELQATNNFQQEFQHADKIKNTENEDYLLNTDQKSKIQQFLQQNKQNINKINNINNNIQQNQLQHTNNNKNNFNQNNNNNYQNQGINSNNKIISQQISNLNSQNKNPLLDENLQQSQQFQNNIGPSITNSMKKRIFQDFASQGQSQVFEENNSYSQRNKLKNNLNNNLSNNESINDFNFIHQENLENNNSLRYKMHDQPYHSNNQNKENLFNAGQFSTFNHNQSIDQSQQKSKRFQENKNIFNRESFYNSKNKVSTAQKSKQKQQQYYISSNCKVSNKPLYNLNGKQTSVYDRLFNDAKKKQQTEQEKLLQLKQEEEQELKKKKLKRSKSMCDNNSSQNGIAKHSMFMYNNQIIQNNQGNEINSGMRLYYRGIKQKEDLKKHLQNLKEQQEIDKSQEYTYNPKINEISSIIASRQRQEPVGEYLNKVAKIQQERRDRARSYKQMAELDQCSFHPQINEISRQISIEKTQINNYNRNSNIKNNNHNVDRFEMLFEDYKVQMERKKSKDMIMKQENQCTFKPKINKTSELIVQDQNFYSRQEKFLQNKHDNIENMQKQILTPSKNSNQKPFQPQTGRANKNRNSRTGSVYENLYKQNPKHKQNQNNNENDYISNLSRSQSKTNKSFERNTSFVNKQSQKIVDNIKQNKITKIFNLLDSDNDGIISAQKIDISKLQPEILEIFSPLLIEMEELDQQLNLEEFQDAADMLIQTLTVEQKNIILEVKKKPSMNENYTFQPQINENSSKLAHNIRPYGQNGIYDTYIEEKQQWTKRMKEQKIVEQQKQLNECSFTPNLSKSKNKYSHVKAKVFQGDVYNSNLSQIQMPLQSSDKENVNQQKQSDEFIPYYYR